MLDHIDFAVSDLENSRPFYTEVLAALGVEPLANIKTDDGREGIGYGSPTGPQFWIGGGDAVSGRMHVAFAANSRAAVDTFYKWVSRWAAIVKGLPDEDRNMAMITMRRS